MDLTVFCLRSFLKGDDNKEYYEVLDLPPSNRRQIQTEDIKKAYKKASLNYHPDKLAQKGTVVTQEHRQKFVKIKDAYEVLSDPKRRRIYDQLGATGLKLIENPHDVSPQKLIKNFQENRSSRVCIAFFIILTFACLFVLPVLFCLKCDGTLGDNVTWIALWTPMWIYDLVAIIAAISLFLPRSKDPELENEESLPDDDVPLPVKLFNLAQTTTFILIQIFILARLDQIIDWNWFAIFAPWFIHEAFTILASLHPAFILPIPLPTTTSDHSASSDVEGGLEEDLLLKQFESEQQYIEKWMKCRRAQMDVVISILRIWLAIFLAVQLNQNEPYNWGLILLPIWLYLLLQVIYAYSFKKWGNAMLETLDTTDAESMKEQKNQMKYNQAQSILSVGTATCIWMFIPLFMALTLVCRLEVSVYTTFVILLPVFIGLFCCCCCSLTALFVVSNMDTDDMEQAHNLQQNQESGSPSYDEVDAFSAAAVPAPAATYDPPKTTGNIQSAPVDAATPATVSPTIVTTELPTYGTFENQPIQDVGVSSAASFGTKPDEIQNSRSLDEIDD